MVLLDLELARGDRVAVRIALGVAELRRNQLLELLREHVLEHLGLVVDAVPRNAQRLREVELEQAVVAEHLQRELRPARGQLDAAVGDVSREAELVEALHHGRRGRRRHAGALGHGVRRDGAIGLRRQGVDRLGVVLYRRGCWYSAVDAHLVTCRALCLTA